MSLNWRRPLIYCLLKFSGSHAPRELRFLRSIERRTRGHIREIQRRRLESLLRHAWQHCDYYQETLTECGAVRDGTVDLDRFDAIPFLTKDIIRTHGARLRAKTLPRERNTHVNRTGGSTGEPLEFYQDNYYDAVNIATKLYHFEVLGKRAGEPEMKIWGSEQDVFKDTIGWSAKAQNFIYNRKLRNCFHLPEEAMRDIVEEVSRYKPKIIWCYRDGMHAIAKYAARHAMRPYSPAAIFCAGGTLYPHIRDDIAAVFRCPVVNYYGSREMGDVACECKEMKGLHISSHSHYVEVIDADERPVVEADGELVITCLTNYAMPFIRYQIGDRGRLTNKSCPCGRGFPLLESVSGRDMETFLNSEGDYVDPFYFIHLVGVVCNTGFVQRFQVVQESVDHITLKIILTPGVHIDSFQSERDDITKKIRLVMGPTCRVDFQYVEDIPLTPSGKYLYTIRNFQEPDNLPLRVE